MQSSGQPVRQWKPFEELISIHTFDPSTMLLPSLFSTRKNTLPRWNGQTLVRSVEHEVQVVHEATDNSVVTIVDQDSPRAVKRRKNSSSTDTTTTTDTDDINDKLDWGDSFMKFGFDAPNSPFPKYCSRRTGRWTRQETKFAVRLIHDLITGTLQTKVVAPIRTILSNMLHTSGTRVFKKFKGHPVLKQLSTNAATDQTILKHMPTLAWNEVHLTGLETIQREILKSSMQQLRQEFLQSIRFDTYMELKYKNKVS